MPRFRLGGATRVAILCALFFLEKILLNKFVDFDRAQQARGFGALVREGQHWGFRFLVALAAALALFAYVRGGERLRASNEALRSCSIRSRWIILHVLLVACLIPLSYLLYRDEATTLPFSAIVVLWILIGGSAALSAIVAMAPWRIWWQAASALGDTWRYAAITAFLSASVIQLSQRLWAPTATLTFNLVRRLLLPFLPTLSADPGTRTLGANGFAVEVSNICSGLEGVGLILAFLGAWLIYFRHEYKFPRALLLVPAGVAAIFLLNVFRIATLMWIGSTGHPDVAVYGFHSQAGWIAFIAVACGLVLLSRRARWLNRAVLPSNAASVVVNPVAAYLMPLLAVLAAGAVSHAISSDFEFFYPLRIILGLLVLIGYRRDLAAIDLRFSWRGPLVGALVFLVWITAAFILLPERAMPAKLAGMPLALRAAWILSRVAGSVLLVPIAEELAYRGYLMRRLVKADFESVAFESIRWPAILVTAVVFGAAHGEMWLPGIAAGVAYGLILIRRGRLGEAMAAHAATNLLITACVLGAHQWQLW